MRIDLTADTGLSVVLSRRNLLALLAKLDEPGSNRTIYRDIKWGSDGYFRVYARSENDDFHYADRQPGVMSPTTTATIEGYGHGV